MMFRSSDDSYDKERATNMSAVTAQLGDSARTMDTRESYEQTYDTGCNYASVGDWAAAEEALASAEKAVSQTKSMMMPAANAAFLRADMPDAG